MQASTDLRSLIEHAYPTEAVRKADLHMGDRVLVTTRNSTYTIWVLGNGQYMVSGGWFDRQGESPATTAINGCTWGGRVIHTGIIAAPGLFLEFGNDVVTTRIQRVRVLRAEEHSIPN
jgi:hypothetical protein